MVHGGAVYVEDSASSFQGCNIIGGNSAQYSTGGIYSKNNNLTFSGSTSFSSNSGQLLGGLEGSMDWERYSTSLETAGSQQTMLQGAGESIW